MGGDGNDEGVYVIRDAIAEAEVVSDPLEGLVEQAAHDRSVDFTAAKPRLPYGPSGLRAALNGLGITVRYNVRAHRAEWREGDDWRPFDDRTRRCIRERIEAAFLNAKGDKSLSFGRERFTDDLNGVLFHCELDPFQEWLESRPTWDGVHRLDRWLGECFSLQEPESPLPEWASQFVFLGAVWRAFKPGTKLDEMPVWIGPPGCGKSTAAAGVLPPDQRGEWFGDQLHLAADPKARVEALQGRVIVECAEMAGSDRAEIESLKAFLSRTNDGGIRLSYRHDPESMPRRCVIVGTANGSPLPNNPGALRRFVAIHIAGGDPASVTRYLDANRDQLWAEALAAYRAGREAWLPQALHAYQVTANEAGRREDTILEDALQEWLPAAPEKFSLADAAKGTGLLTGGGSASRLPPRDQQRLTAALRHAGYEACRTRNGRYWAKAEQCRDTG